MLSVLAQVFSLCVLFLVVAVFYTIEAPVLWPSELKLGLQLFVGAVIAALLAALLIAT